jgi:opacity protein-like surface antigen
MKRFLPVMTVAGLLAGAAPAAAQIGFVVGGGVSVPVGEFGEFAKSGWMALGGAQLGIPLFPLKFRAEGLFGRNTHEGASGDKTTLYGGMANAIFQIGPPLVPVKPYVIAGVGYLNHRYSPGAAGAQSDSEWKPVFGGGAGVGLNLLVIGVFVEARYLRRDDTGFIPVIVGVRLGG